MDEKKQEEEEEVALVQPSASAVHEVDLYRSLNNDREAALKAKKFYPRYFDVEDTKFLIIYGGIKMIVLFILLFANSNCQGLAALITSCTEVEVAKVGTVCKSNTLPTDVFCGDLYSVCGQNCVAMGFDLGLGKCNSTTTSGVAVTSVMNCFTTVDSYKSTCVNIYSCSKETQSSVTTPLSLLLLVNIFSFIMETMQTFLLQKFQEYTEDDFAIEDGYIQKAGLGILKATPSITTASHAVYLFVVLWLGLETIISGVDCQYALDTAGAQSQFYVYSFYLFLACFISWFVFTFVGFRIRSTVTTNEFLFSPSTEISRNVPIDFDCTWARFRKDPNETSEFRKLVQSFSFQVSRCIIGCGGFLYFLLSNRKNLGA